MGEGNLPFVGHGGREVMRGLSCEKAIGNLSDERINTDCKIPHSAK